MCGICGFTQATGSAVDHATLKAMCDVMAHRGPDGEGRYIADGIALGHRRLSLVDIGGGGQPMVRKDSSTTAGVFSPAVSYEHVRGESAAVLDDACLLETESLERGRWSIVYNGEIYNYRELREELRGLGYEFTTDSDTEVLLVSYIAWSEEMLSKLRGMFAFAIYDAQDRELFCARDFFGIKPFYYTQAGGRFVFASEIKSILEHPSYERAVNEDAFAQYLCFQFSALHETLFKDVYRLPQGHCLRVHADGSIDMRCYWKPRYDVNAGRSLEDSVEAIDRAMRESVRFHNVADVEVGSFLSSGIDSSYLAACLCRQNPSIKTFTVGFSEYEGERDEVSWARELAAMLDVQNDAHHISEEEYWRVLPLVQWHMDEPSADPSAVALYFVDQLAAKRVKAVLSGEGADELFGGYRVYQTPFANEHVEWVPKTLLRAGSKILHSAHLRGAGYLERASEGVEDWYYTNANGVAFSVEERDRVIAADVRARLHRTRHEGGARWDIGFEAREAGEHADRAFTGLPTPQQLAAPVYAEVAGLDETSRMQHVDLWFWLAGDILVKTDKMAMAHSLESRVPFLDREVFRLAATLPTEQKVDGHQTKIALREAAERAIPRAWAQKEKLGFPVPLGNWLREERYCLRVREEFESAHAQRFFATHEILRLLDEHREGVHDHTRKIWIIYSFLVWYRVFFVEGGKPA